MDIVSSEKLKEKDISIIRALQNYAEEHGCSLERIVFPIGGTK